MVRNSIIDIYIAVFMFILFLSTRNKSTKDSSSSRRFGQMVLLLTILTVTDAVSWSYLENPDPIGTQFIFIFQYIMTMALILQYGLYLKYFFAEYYQIELKGGETFFRIIFWTSSAIWILSMPFHWFYEIYPDGTYSLTPYYSISQIGAVIMLIPSWIGILKNAKHVGAKNCLLWISFMVIPILARPVDLLLELPMLFPTMAMSAFLVYTQINVETARLLKNKELELLDSNQKIMVSQIQPHFLYNVLNTICCLIRKDPKAAENTTNDFATYLRMNLTAISKKNPVRFEEELGHVETYLRLEKVRFRDEMEISYDIRVSDFYIPVLSLQPLVENAVKHGICQKDGGGTVTVSTWEDEKNFYVAVKDDGVGFEVDKAMTPDGRTHIGMENTRKRIKEQCRGELRIESKLGVGTSATIVLPKEVNATCRSNEKS